MTAQKTVLVFGAFDGLHEGHRFFLRQARKLGDRLVASVAEDCMVRDIKHHLPLNPLAKRIGDLKASGLIDEAVAGDTVFGEWSAISRFNPDTIALGYDQSDLKDALEYHIDEKKLPIRLVLIPPHEPDRFHSSFLRKVR